MSIACAAVLLSVSACTTDHSDAGQSTRPQASTTPGPAAAGTVADTTQSSLRKPPELDPGASLAGRQKVTTGNAVVPYIEGKKGDALIISVSCQGKGKITVAVKAVHVSFLLECGADQVSSVSNQVAVSGVERSGVVAVEAPPAVRWSLTVGRGAPAEAEPPDAG
ncbi:hypothetical protein ACFCYB_21345 [Streptomyces sp. NPDC056309]|uniref:hypothetical protein n=1 Tax=unclassified Streptomyces TaxID=2593676 RepID=UPI0035DB6372